MAGQSRVMILPLTFGWVAPGKALMASPAAGALLEEEEARRVSFR